MFWNVVMMLQCILYLILVLLLLLLGLGLLLLLHPRSAGDFMRDFSKKLVPLLEDKIRVMIYAGGRTASHAPASHCTA
jgi:uncharacterized protein YneF (UPF0154 family)